MKWRIIGIVASIIPLFLIAIVLNVGPKEIISVGIVPFVLAALVAVAKLLVQGIRYNYYVKSFVGYVASLSKNIEVRTGSEFVSLTTPAYIGGEFVRLSWLHKNGVHGGKGMWIITAEVISDVLVGTALAYVAAALAFLSQNYLIAAAIVAITTPICATYVTLLVLSSRKTLQMPRFIHPLLSKLLGSAKGEKWISSVNDTLKVLCETSKENLQYSSMKIFASGLALTFVAASMQALTFFILANTSVNIGFFSSLMAISSSSAIGTVPISSGGSGLSEFGLGYYLNTFKLNPALLGSAIIAWRIASYHVPLVLSWAVLMRMTRRTDKSSV